MRFSSTNFFRFNISTFLTFLLFTFAFSLFTISYGQVKIKEKVEITPTQIGLEGINKVNSNSYPRGNTPCGPYIENTVEEHYWQVVWAGYWGPIDPRQQLFEVQGDVSFSYFINSSNSPYDIEIIEGAEYCNYLRYVPIEEIENGWTLTEVEDNRLEGLTSREVMGEGDWWLFDCVPRHLDDLEQYYIKYKYIEEDNVTVTYSIYNAAQNTTKYFHTQIVKRQFILEEPEEPIILPHGEKTEISLRPLGVHCTSLDSTQYYADYNCKDIWSYSGGGDFPENVYFNVTVMEGTEYGELYYLDGEGEKIINNNFTNLEERTYNYLEFESNGIEPEDTGKVRIKINTTDATIPEAELELQIVPNKTYPLKVEIVPTELMEGDTADIVLQQRYEDYPFSNPAEVNYESFPAGQLFNVRIEKGSEYCSLLNTETGETGNEFTEIEEGFKLIANKNIEIDTVKISIRVTTIINEGIIFFGTEEKDKKIEEEEKLKIINPNERKIVTIKVKNKLNKSNNISSIASTTFPSGEEIFGIGKAEITQNEIEIMLGETKYFQAIYRDPTTNKLEIREVNVGTNGVPSLDGGLAQNVWGNNPITIVHNADTSGRRSGVYWETNKPVWDGLTNRGNLETGLIRIIGRYWHQDSSYVVKLKAGRTNGDSAEVNIRVVRPHILYSNTGNLISNYIVTNDVTGHPLNIDSLCFLFGGKNGIPPQIIKGQMYTESYKDRQRLYPTYRYEPFTDLGYQRTNNDVLNTQNRFVVNSIDMGTGDPIPNTHTNIHPIDYPRRPIMIYSFLADNLREYISRRRIFYNTDEAAELNRYLSNRINMYELQDIGNPFNQALDDLINQIRNGRFQELNRIAQTRIVASYGFLQQTFYNAVDPNKQFYGFTRTASDHPPELLNHQNYFMEVYVERLKWYTNRSGIELLGFNWEEGYEERWNSSLTSYNPGDANYHTNIITNSLEFLPMGE